MIDYQQVYKVPTLPHLKKFILKMFKCHEPVKIEEDSIIGKSMMSLLIDKRQVKRSNERYTDSITIVLSKEMSKRSPRIYNLVKVNTEFDQLFKHFLFQWIIAQDSVGIPAYESTEMFLKTYGIKETEYSKEAAYRAWLRYKNNEYQKERMAS